MRPPLCLAARSPTLPQPPPGRPGPPGGPGPVAQPAPHPAAPQGCLAPAPAPPGPLGSASWQYFSRSFPPPTAYSHLFYFFLLFLVSLYRGRGEFSSPLCCFFLFPGFAPLPLAPFPAVSLPLAPPPPFVCPGARTIIAVYEVLTGLCQAALSKQPGVTD